MYRIIVTPNYYEGTLGAPTEHFLTYSELGDYEDNPDHANNFSHAVYDTEDEAQAVIDDLEDGNYYLAHGEVGRPVYRIIGDDDDLGPDCVDCSDYFNGDPFFTRINPDQIPGYIRDDLVGANVEFDHDDSDTSYYTACIEDDDRRYWIVYAVRSIAIDNCDGDISAINWDNESYWREAI